MVATPTHLAAALEEVAMFKKWRVMGICPARSKPVESCEAECVALHCAGFHIFTFACLYV